MLITLIEILSDYSLNYAINVPYICDQDGMKANLKPQKYNYT